MDKGELFPDYYITCGGCGYGQHVGERDPGKARRAAKRDLGFRLTKARGWLCRDCAAALSGEEPRDA